MDKNNFLEYYLSNPKEKSENRKIAMLKKDASVADALPLKIILTVSFYIYTKTSFINPIHHW